MHGSGGLFDRRTAVRLRALGSVRRQCLSMDTWRVGCREIVLDLKGCYLRIYPVSSMPEPLMDHIRENWEEYRNGR
jgi:hypothetical protein